MRSSRGPGRKYTQTHTESLTEVQCIVMKIKDTLITAAKWYWTSVNAGEGTSKNEDSWTSHKMEWLSACAWGCKWGTWAPNSRTTNGPTLPWARWLHGGMAQTLPTSGQHLPTTALLYPGDHSLGHQRLPVQYLNFPHSYFLQWKLGVLPSSSSFMKIFSAWGSAAFLYLTLYVAGNWNSHLPLHPSKPEKILDFLIG